MCITEDSRRRWAAARWHSLIGTSHPGLAQNAQRTRSAGFSLDATSTRTGTSSVAPTTRCSSRASFRFVGDAGAVLGQPAGLTQACATVQSSVHAQIS